MRGRVRSTRASASVVVDRSAGPGSIGWDRPPAAKQDAPADHHCEIPEATTALPTTRSTTLAPVHHRTVRPTPVARRRGRDRSLPGTLLRRRRSLGWSFRRPIDVAWLESPTPATREDYPASDPSRTPKYHSRSAQYAKHGLL